MFWNRIEIGVSGQEWYEIRLKLVNQAKKVIKPMNKWRMFLNNVEPG